MVWLGLVMVCIGRKISLLLSILGVFYSRLDSSIPSDSERVNFMFLNKKYGLVGVGNGV